MSFKKNIAVIVIGTIAMFCAASGRPVNADYTVKWLILPQCTVSVNGSTNINRFRCTIAGYTSDTLTCVVSKENHGTVAINGNMKLPVFGFDCANTMMTKDLRKTLKEKEHPYFYIHFVSMERYPLLSTELENIVAIVNIELAGVKKQLEIHFNVSVDALGIIELAGTQNIYFSDFNLTAPRKLGGMIKAGDKLTVEFIIHCRVIK